MSALIKKEIRLLLPSFGIALLLAFSVWLVPLDLSDPGLRIWVGILPFFLCPAMVLKMTLDSFGGEINSGTFSNLLSQPVPRSRIWRTKTILLAIALTLVVGVWWLSFLGNAPRHMTVRDLDDLTVMIILFGIAAYSGGLWTVLLLRQIAAAFWLTLLVPAALAMFMMYFTEKLTDGSGTERNIIIVLAAYSVVGCFWARRMFLRAQDFQWTGGTIALPGWLKLPQWLVPTRMTEGRRPQAALLAKEFQLHQSQLLIAAALALLHLGMIVARKAGSGFKDSPMLELATFQFWVLWLVMPLLIGCAAVAEERKLGTLEAQLCLPARRRTQFVIKFGFALMLAIVSGVIVPVLLEGRRILPNFHANIEAALTGFYYGSMPQGILLLTVVEVVNALDPWLPLLPLFLLAVGFVAISFYASTLVRNTLQAIAPAILGVLLAWALLLGAHQSVIKGFVHYPLWRGPLIYFIGIPALGVTLAGLTYWNFKRVLVGWPVWRRNLVVFVSSLALVIAMTSAIYHRAWEFLITPREPAHGPVRLTQSQRVVMQTFGSDIAVQVDGRVWSTRYALSTPGWAASLLGDWRVVEMFGGGRFLKGTNWTTVVPCALDVIGLQNDGSLWVSEQPENFWRFMRRGQPSKREAIKLVKFGNDSDWKNLVGRSTDAFMLKNDGTLWHLGTNQFKGKTKWPGLRSFTPRRVGADSDWAEIFPDNYLTALRKKDGRVYVYQHSSIPPVESLTLDANMSVERAPYLEGHRWRSTTWSQSRRIGSFHVGVAEDGKFCVSATWQPVPGKRLGQTRWVAQDIQLGKESNWLAVAGNGESVVTLRSDGSLWKWHFKDDPLTQPENASPTRLGTHSDWLAVVGTAGSVVSLAADGTLWFWRFEPQNFYASRQGLVPLLGVTRKPQLIANIFGKAE